MYHAFKPLFIFAFLVFSVSATIAQPGRDRCGAGKHCPMPCRGGDGEMRADGAAEFAPGQPGAFAHWARAMKFIYNDDFRRSLETKMTAADRQTIESTVSQVKTTLATMKEHRPQFQSAREAKDTATINKMMLEAKPMFEQLKANRKTILDILAKYKNGKAASPATPSEPVYPNPLHLGGDAATFRYHLLADGPVRITLTDAGGRSVQEFSNSYETAGDHTGTIGAGITKPGVYYINIEADGKKSTQKVAVVE